MLCDYGCGQKAKHQFKNYKWCCSLIHTKCPIVRNKNSSSSMNPSEETRKKLSNSQKSFRTGKTYDEIYGKEKADYLKELRRQNRLGKKNPMYGKTCSPEAKRKNRESHLGEKNHFYGKCHSEKSIIKNREAHLGKNLGLENPNWKGGIASEPYCDIWLDQDYKQSIKDRDENKCINPCCLNISKKLCVHHIDYVKKNCHPLNLATLCNSCNSKANKDREWHKFWYRAIIYRRYIWR